MLYVNFACFLHIRTNPDCSGYNQQQGEDQNAYRGGVSELRKPLAGLNRK